MTKGKKHVKRSTCIYSYSRSGTFANAVRSEALKRAPAVLPTSVSRNGSQVREKKTELANKVPSLSYFFSRLSRLGHVGGFFSPVPRIGFECPGSEEEKTKKMKVGFYESGIAPKMDGLLLFSGRFFSCGFWGQATKKVRVAVLGRLFGDACEKAVGTCTCTFGFSACGGGGKGTGCCCTGTWRKSTHTHTHAIILQVCVSHL